jgi:hypothetical protein
MQVFDERIDGAIRYTAHDSRLCMVPYMFRFLGSFLLFSSLASTVAVNAQIPTDTTVTTVPSMGTYGTGIGVSAGVTGTLAPFATGTGAIILPTGTVQFLDGTKPLSAAPIALAAGAAFNTASFSKVFGTLDPAFASLPKTGQTGVDLNGDGVQDLLVFGASSFSASEEVQTFLANGSGGYTASAAQTLTLPASPVSNSFFIGDLNGDGKPDLLLGGSVAYGNGDGTFQQPVALSFLASGYSETFAGDVTGDGKPDIVALNTVPSGLANTPYTLQVTVFANQGSGNFQSLGTFPVATSQVVEFASLASLEIVDVNGDGKADLVTQAYFLPAGEAAEPATVAVALNNGDGTFAAPVQASYNAQTNGGDIELESLRVGDFNNDGKVDLLLIYPAYWMANFTQPFIFLPGNGDGTFGAETDSMITTPYVARGAATGQPPAGRADVLDVNLDGNLDVAFGSGAVVLGDGTGHFTSGMPFITVPDITANPGQIPLAHLALVKASGAAYTSFVFVPTVVATHNFTATASLPALTLAAGTHSITARYSGDSHYAASTSTPSVVTITASTGAMIAVTPSANPSYSGQAVTFSIAVSGAGATPTGTVTLQGTQTPPGIEPYPQQPPSGTATLDGNGKATIAVTLVDVDLGPLVFTYNGDANYAPAMISTRQTVNSTFGVVYGASIPTISSTSSPTATTQISVAGVTGFRDTVTLGCKDLPATLASSFSPASLNISGSSTQSSTLTISNATGSTASLNEHVSGNGLRLLTCGLFTGSLLLFWPGKRRAMWQAGWFVIAFASLLLLPTGCGGNSTTTTVSAGNLAAGTYPFYVTATAGTVQLQYNYVLTVH